MSQMMSEVELDKDELRLDVAPEISDHELMYQKILERCLEPINYATKQLTVKVGDVIRGVYPYGRFLKVLQVSADNTRCKVDAWNWLKHIRYEDIKDGSRAVTQMVEKTERDSWQEIWKIEMQEYPNLRARKKDEMIQEWHVVVEQENRRSKRMRQQCPFMAKPPEDIPDISDQPRYARPIWIAKISKEEADALEIEGPAKIPVRAETEDSQGVRVQDPEHQSATGEGREPGQGHQTSLGKTAERNRRKKKRGRPAGSRNKVKAPAPQPEPEPDRTPEAQAKPDLKGGLDP